MAFIEPNQPRPEYWNPDKSVYKTQGELTTFHHNIQKPEHGAFALAVREYTSFSANINHDAMKLHMATHHPEMNAALNVGGHPGWSNDSEMTHIKALDAGLNHPDFKFIRPHKAYTWLYTDGSQKMDQDTHPLASLKEGQVYHFPRFVSTTSSFDRVTQWMQGSSPMHVDLNGNHHAITWHLPENYNHGVDIHTISSYPDEYETTLARGQKMRKIGEEITSASGVTGKIFIHHMEPVKT